MHFIPLQPLSFKGVFDQCGPCVLPIGGGRVLRRVVLYGYQDTVTDSEQLGLTHMLLGVALLCAVIGRGPPTMIHGDFNVVFTRVPCLLKGLSAGHWVDLKVLQLVFTLLLLVNVLGNTLVVTHVIS